MTATAARAEALPLWNLGDLYGGPDDPQIESDLKSADEDGDAFAAAYEGKLAELSGGALAKAIDRYEVILEKLSKVMSFAQLLHAADTGNPEIGRFYQSVQEKVTMISTETLFFTLELNRLGDDDLDAKLEDENLARYAPWLRELRVFKPYQLKDDLERLLHEKSVAGRAAWVRLFDEMMADLRFEVTGEEKTLGEVLNLLTDADGAKRKQAAEALTATLYANRRVLSLITNTLAKDKEIEDRWRDHEHPMQQRNLANQVEKKVVDALIAAVKDSYGDLSHRYYRLKAGWFGSDQLDYWDRNAPLPEADDRSYGWTEARDIVLDAYAGFEPEMARIARRFFDESWIDARPRPGKTSGAFSHPTVSSAHPYVLVNFHGKSRDVMTLAHELGHGVHQVLAAPLGNLLAATPLTLAETASVFGEMLTFRSLLDTESDPSRRKILLASKVEDMMNTVVRQIAFHEFEHRVHIERPEGELSAERICEIWMETQSDSLGPAVRLDEGYRMYWAYVPHFLHTPFYVYAYAFGDCLVNTLYDVFAGGTPEFQAKYLDMLRAGGTLRHTELLAPFGLDASDPAFWRRGLGVISSFIDDLEELEA